VAQLGEKKGKPWRLGLCVRRKEFFVSFLFQLDSFFCFIFLSLVALVFILVSVFHVFFKSFCVYVIYCPLPFHVDLEKDLNSYFYFDLSFLLIIILFSNLFFLDFFLIYDEKGSKKGLQSYNDISLHIAKKPMNSLLFFYVFSN
jgi:hypothetical protein